MPGHLFHFLNTQCEHLVWFGLLLVVIDNVQSLILRLLSFLTMLSSVQFSSVQSLSCVQLFETHGPQHARSPCPNRLILCCPLLRLPSIFSSTRVFSKESVLCIRWPKYWSCSFSISPANEYSEYLGWTGSISLLPKGLSRVSSNTTVQKHRFFDTLLSYSPTLTSIHDYWKNHSFD